MQTSGLRETKKVATRQALARAVLTLATRDGIDHVTIEAAAAEAGVSVRTFHNYFSGKEDALVYYVADLVSRIIDVVGSRPHDESFWESLRFSLTQIATSFDGTEADLMVTLLRLFDTEPTLTAHSQQIDLSCTVDARLAEMMIERGLDPDTFRPHLIFTTALAAARSAVEFWVAHRDTIGSSLREILDDAFDQLTVGMAQPLPSHPQEF